MPLNPNTIKSYICIAIDKVFFVVVFLFLFLFFFSTKSTDIFSTKTCSEYSLEVPSKDYPQHVFVEK